MRAFSQRDKRWKDLRIGKTVLTMEHFGCLIVSLAMLNDQDPDEVLAMLNRSNAFNDKGMLYSDIAAKTLGFRYRGKSKKAPKYPCVAETDHYAHLHTPSHFFIWQPNGLIIDPLDGFEKNNPYNIVSYRLFKKKPAEELPREITMQTPSYTVTTIKEPTLLERIISWLTNLIKR